jgi:hypothetical protein
MNAVEECPDDRAQRAAPQQQCDPTVDAWADAEAAFESFIARYTDFNPCRMKEPDFTQWKRDHLRLYLEVWRAQMAYYQALRGKYNYQLYLEYRRVQEDLDAFLNVPEGVTLSLKYFATVRWLKNRLSELGKQLFLPKAS